MGGHAFKDLYCPRIPPNVYAEVKSITTAALRTVFSHVTVPFEIPGKPDYGDIDFLVSAPLGEADLTLSTFPFQRVVQAIKYALDTPHGRRGFLTPDCMYFAIPMPATSSACCLDDNEGCDISECSDEEPETWVQIDVKVCFKPESFLWTTFELDYASQSSILGSMVNPLGLTLDPEGLHVRVREMESTDWAGSMVWVSKDPWTVCRVLGLSRKVVDGAFESGEEIYEEYTSSWLFHPGNFKAKLEDESYLVQHPHRSNFLKKWIPERYSEHKSYDDGEGDLEAWTARTRLTVKEKIFTMFPHVAEGYYAKRSHHVNEVEERRLRDLITAAIPTGTDGWRDDFNIPHIVIRQPAIQTPPSTPRLHPALPQHGEFTPPPSPTSRPQNTPKSAPAPIALDPNHPSTTLYIDALPRQPPHPCKPAPPPQSMSAAARLACLARWTAFSATGSPYLLTSPHAKDFDLQWREAVEAGSSDAELAEWAQAMWWVVWVRQCVVNWRGMWAKRFEKEDVRAEKARVEGMREEEVIRCEKEVVRRRLEGLNRALALLVED
ncbi:hypothetical protein C7974DRAFT_426890 [Boeremia exigua]|uniref:uncharacterized protein n=1 Tax=Boeremia exigua TaxID=749465 RepID=UPI001E8D9F0D|nr:uncharacterized protein C7974DRAFT_426890 [Boeremia exigua]KAH6618620.1 hypothetical protein C7974DRAFT_426890 [Boeremia exigua]